MKKVLSVLLVLCMNCAAFASFAEETAADFLGTWVLDRYVYGSLELEKDVLESEYQISWTLEMKEDGTFHSITGDGEADGTWTETDNGLELIYAEGYVFQVAQVDDTLHITTDVGDGALAEYYMVRQEQQTTEDSETIP